MPKRPTIQVPDVLYHASRHPEAIATFTPLSHFGTLQAALDRAAGGTFSGIGDPLIHEVRLDVRNPLRMPDLHQTNHSWLKIVDHLHYDQRVLTGAERNAVFDAAAPSGSNTEGGDARLCGILLAKGYDAIVYENQHEDPGSLSWIILDPTTVSVLRSVPRSELEGIAPAPC